MFVALHNDPYETPVDVSIKLSDLDLTKYSDYDFYESFSGTHIGKFHNSDTYSFSINPSSDVQAFYVQSATTTKSFRLNLEN